MRIASQGTLQPERLSIQQAASKTAAFSMALKTTQTQLQNDALNGWVMRIDARGQMLASQRTLENLVEYKQAIKQFIGETVRCGLYLADEQSRTSKSRLKPAQIIKIIDQKLIEIHDQILDNEKDGIGTLDLVGEIKGMLINLYM